MTDHTVNPFSVGAHRPPQATEPAPPQAEPVPRQAAEPVPPQAAQPFDPPAPSAGPPPYRGPAPGPVDWTSFMGAADDHQVGDAAVVGDPSLNGHTPPSSTTGGSQHDPFTGVGTIDLTDSSWGAAPGPAGGVVTDDRAPLGEQPAPILGGSFPADAAWDAVARDRRMGDRTQVGMDPVTGRVAGVVDQPVSASRMDAIEVTSWFGKRKVLEGCTLSMEPGEVTALIGPSGCGKSTFLRALNRMHELVPGAAIAGQILLDGVDIYSEAMSPTEVRLRVGMVFQKPNPFPAMSIRENVLAGLKLSGTDHPDHEELVEQCLRRAGLWAEVKDRLDEGGMSLSGGQQQRLCIARSLAVHPDVLLMDEPCSALDPISTGVIEETIRELCHDITIIIVTHNMQQAQRVSDQCAFFLVEELNVPGRIVEHGPTERMFSNPSDPRTLDYVSGRFG